VLDISGVKDTSDQVFHELALRSRRVWAANWSRGFSSCELKNVDKFRLILPHAVVKLAAAASAKLDDFLPSAEATSTEGVHVVDRDRTHIAASSADVAAGVAAGVAADVSAKAVNPLRSVQSNIEDSSVNAEKIVHL
jgi:hypothetical protein